MARPERFELPTPRFVVWCSIQLSYGRLPTNFGTFPPLAGPKNGNWTLLKTAKARKQSAPAFTWFKAK